MTKETLAHLNRLRNSAQPIVFCDNWTVTGPRSEIDALWPRLTAVIEATTPEMIRREIIAAADEDRKGDICDPVWRPYDATQPSFAPSGIPWSATRRTWDLARLEILAIVDADNVRRREIYENYRLACAQGVAVPPAAKQ